MAFDFLLLYGFLYVVYNLQQYYLPGKPFDAGSLIRSFARDIKIKLKNMSLKVDGCLPQI